MIDAVEPTISRIAMPAADFPTFGNDLRCEPGSFCLAGSGYGMQLIHKLVVWVKKLFNVCVISSQQVHSSKKINKSLSYVGYDSMPHAWVVNQELLFFAWLRCELAPSACKSDCYCQA